MNFHVEDRFHWGALRVFAYTDAGDTRRFHQGDGLIVTIQEGMMTDDIKPLFEIDYQSAPRLIEALMRAGTRPVEISKVEGMFEAQTAHLKDLQNLLRKQGYMA